MKWITLTVVLSLLTLWPIQSEVSPVTLPDSRMAIALTLLNSMSEEQKTMFRRSFDDPLRTKWARLPGVREGLKLSKIGTAQKTLLHKFLQKSFSQAGYLLVTSQMFNEDIQKKFEPNIGRNEFWIELFGLPQNTNFWGLKLEGHHLSVNLTFKGEEMISHTPFLFGSNPQIVNSDEERNGLCFIYTEEEIAGKLTESLNKEQKLEGYTDRKRPAHVYGEENKEALVVPNEGLNITKLSKTQKEMIKSLALSYMHYFTLNENETLKEILTGTTRFFFMQNTAYNGEHYYRIENRTTLIECENYGNHTHHLWRSTNDFGKERIK